MRKKLSNIKWPITEISNNQIVPIKAAPENTDYLLNRLGIKVRLNLMTKKINIQGGGLKNKSFDAAITDIRGALHQNGLKLSKIDSRDIIISIAENNAYSPVCEYLTKCQKEWDGKDHLNEVYNLFELDHGYNQDKEFCRLLIKRWLISCVKMAFNTGDIAAQGVLLLVGSQGLGKTRILKTLVPCADWVTDGMQLDPDRKDSIIKAISFWIVEIGEFGKTMQANKVDALKQFITMGMDTLRKPYRAEVESFPRRTVFIGSINNDDHGGFLRDITGNRRYWPIAIKSIDRDAQININQVWGEIMIRAFDEKEPYYLSESEIERLAELNHQFEVITPAERTLLDLLDWDADMAQWQRITASSLCDRLGLHLNQSRRIGRALHSLHNRDNRIQIPTNHHERLYLVPPIKWQ